MMRTYQVLAAVFLTLAAYRLCGLLGELWLIWQGEGSGWNANFTILLALGLVFLRKYRSSREES